MTQVNKYIFLTFFADKTKTLILQAGQHSYNSQAALTPRDDPARPPVGLSVIQGTMEVEDTRVARERPRKRLSKTGLVVISRTCSSSPTTGVSGGARQSMCSPQLPQQVVPDEGGING